MSELKLPEGFVLGTATSAYQVEGAWDVDGKGPSIWDAFTALPGKTEGSVSGRDGVDHFHRYAEDIRHMREIGLDSYRFSLSWPRLLPEGTGRVNQAGLDFYRLPGGNYLANGQEFYPRALSDAARVVRGEYAVTVPIYITENGLSVRTEALVDGRVHDADRITYLTGFLQDAVRAVGEGLDIRGYYIWSLLDNYEWTASYTARFGLIRVDTADMDRIWKDSAYWFQRLCATHTLALDQ